MEKILVALSGGVDSSTSAALLQEQGYEVEGAIMVFEGVSDEDIDYARKAAQKLNIPFHCFDFTEEYQRTIIDNFIREYKNGRTPNPCIRCNKHIKFGRLLKHAGKMAINKIATGHYAGIGKENDRFLLKRGVDKNEQSYFLYRLSQKQLSKIVFPLGTYKKQGVRKLAEKFDLPTAKRKKSQDVCFIPGGDYASYLKRILPSNPGPILDSNNKIIGEHKGICFYTCGQRRGLGVSGKYPYYVTKIDAEHNTIYVGERQDGYKSDLIAEDPHFIPFDNLERKLKILAKPRYVSTLSEATIEPCQENKVKVIFEKAQWALTPGQSIVFYDNDMVVGGAVIEEIL